MNTVIDPLLAVQLFGHDSGLALCKEISRAEQDARLCAKFKEAGASFVEDLGTEFGIAVITLDDNTCVNIEFARVDTEYALKKVQRIRKALDPLMADLNATAWQDAEYP